MLGLQKEEMQRYFILISQGFDFNNEISEIKSKMKEFVAVCICCTFILKVSSCCCVVCVLVTLLPVSGGALPLLRRGVIGRTCSHSSIKASTYTLRRHSLSPEYTESYSGTSWLTFLQW